MEQVDFQKVLLKVQDSLGLDEVLDLVFLCSDLLKKDLSHVTIARDLFSLLHSNDLLSSDDPSLLTELLQVIRRPNLVRDLCLEPQPQLRCNHISPYRRLLYVVKENSSSDDLKNFKFLLLDSLPRTKLKEDTTMLQLFLEMEKKGLLDADNLDILEDIIKTIRPQLLKQIAKFKTERVAGVIAQEAKPISNHNSLDLSVTTKAVQPESAVPYGDVSRTSHVPSVPEDKELLLPSGVSLSHQSPASFTSSSGYTSRDEEVRIDNLSLRESHSPVQSQSGEITSAAEETNPSGPDQRSQSAFPKLEEYSMTGDWRGFCLIINNYKFTAPNLKDRNGTDADEKRLTDVFQWLGFETRTVKNCNRTRMLEAMEELRARDHTRADCVVCCVLTHGYDGGIYGVDGNCVSLSELVEPLSGQRCSQLGHKPKLFFIQACQGTKNQGVVFLQTDDFDDRISCDAAVPKNSMPSDAHFLMALATVPLHTSYRDKVKGTWFIQTLCEDLVLMVPRGVDLLSILTQVNSDVGRKTDSSGTKKQIPQPGFTLTKRVVFPVPKQPPPS
ncbi:caspase-8 [Brachyhypopomus gauderio]|uniref:caspase-8 n=1 Tax=Brachyhypopomus gauderio TaxID=698409 RepID=UPI004042AEFE